MAEAEKFKKKFSALFLATTTDNDSALQANVRQLSDQRVAKGKSAVSIIFWDEIVAALALNPVVFEVLYPTLQPLRLRAWINEDYLPL